MKVEWRSIPFVKFGVVTDLAHATLLKSQGWDYIDIFVCEVVDEVKEDELKWLPIPVLAGARLLPDSMKIVGESVDFDALTSFMKRVTTLARDLGIKVLAFGSGQSRNILDGFDRERARQQIIDFLKMSGPLARENGAVIALESLNKTECNFINSLTEAAELAREVNHVGVKLLYDSYHAWIEDESLANLRSVSSLIRHVHVADRQNRMAPGLSGQSDYRAAFRILKEASYQGTISVEASWDIAKDGPRVLDFLKKQWAKA